MSTGEKIQCTVAILTYNSGATLERALISAKDFAEIIVCDGGSTDDTRSIALRHGATIISQDIQYKDLTGRIIDFSGVRNQTLRASTKSWFFYLDSDEVLTEALVQEIKNIVFENEVAAWWIDRKYLLNDRIVDCAATYPTRQMRFFHKNAITTFIKTIHERVEVTPGALVKTSRAYMLVPISPDPMVWRRKWDHYISLEVARRGRLSISDWLLLVAGNMKVSALYLFRYGRNLVCCSGFKMPWALEWERHVYHIRLCFAFRISLR